ncbi:phytoene/squalene synthase family protein [Jatrophihabitans sp. DSM 45814]
MTSSDTAELHAAYQYCRRLNARHGKTFYLATALLPASKRPPIHALYGFARFADDIVDQSPDSTLLDGSPSYVATGSITALAERTARLGQLRDEVSDALSGRPARHPVVRAMADTVQRFDIDHRYIEDFLDSMAQDLTVTRYASFSELKTYMWGSASVIGLQLLPILGVTGDRSHAESAASNLGVAFQLTNFIRDVREDYSRGRIYLPQRSITERGVTEVMFSAPTASPELRALIADEIDRARGFYERALAGIALLAPDSRHCVRTALVLYSDILTEIEQADYDVLRRRVQVPRRRRIAVGSRGYLGALAARRPR